MTYVGIITSTCFQTFINLDLLKLTAVLYNNSMTSKSPFKPFPSLSLHTYIIYVHEHNCLTQDEQEKMAVHRVHDLNYLLALKSYISNSRGNSHIFHQLYQQSLIVMNQLANSFALPFVQDAFKSISTVVSFTLQILHCCIQILAAVMVSFICYYVHLMFLWKICVAVS